MHLLIGDVSGHGPDEAALGVALRIAWRALVLAGLPPAAVLLGVEQVLLAERGDDERFATVAMVSLTPDLSQAEVLLCGHPAPLLIQGDDVVRDRRRTPRRCSRCRRAGPSEPSTVDLTATGACCCSPTAWSREARAPGAADRFGVDGARQRTCESLVPQGIPRAELAPTLLAEAERRHGGPLPDDVAVLLIGTAGWWC